jgi:hypothetical protein
MLTSSALVRVLTKSMIAASSVHMWYEEHWSDSYIRLASVVVVAKYRAQGTTSLTHIKVVYVCGASYTMHNPIHAHMLVYIIV